MGLSSAGIAFEVARGYSHSADSNWHQFFIDLRGSETCLRMTILRCDWILSPKLNNPTILGNGFSWPYCQDRLDHPIDARDVSGIQKILKTIWRAIGDLSQNGFGDLTVSSMGTRYIYRPSSHEGNERLRLDQIERQCQKTMKFSTKKLESFNSNFVSLMGPFALKPSSSKKHAGLLEANGR